MSQVSIVDIEGNNPQIPTRFNANVGFAIPIANTLEILGAVVNAGSVPVQTVGSGNTITTDVQVSQAIAASNRNNVGLAAFDSADFTVDSDGFVSLIGTTTTESFNVDAHTAPGTDPVLPDGSGIVTVTGSQVASGTVGANVIRTNSLAANTYTIEIQRTTAVVASDSTKNGVGHFNSSEFSVDSNGFVSLIGGSLAVDSFAMQTGTSPVVPTVAGLVNFNGSVVAAGTNPVRTDGTGANTMALEIQISQALAATDATKIGLSNFNSAFFTVDANGFVGGTTITGSSGGALSPTAANFNLLGSSTAAGTTPISIAGAVSTLTVNVQKSQAIAATDATKVGLANFNSAQFSVDANGFVSLSGGGLAIDSIGTQTGTNPIAPNSAGLVTINGAVVAAGTNPIRSNGTGANTMAMEVQISQAIAAADATKIGLSNFSSTDFAVTATGFVTLSTTGAAKTITGQSGGALSPVANNWNIFGGTVIAGTTPVATSGTGNTLTTNVQISQAIAATDATKIGLSNFNSAHFSVDANGFVSLSGGGLDIDSIGTQTGTNPITPDGAGLVTINGAVVTAGTNPVRSHGTAASTMAIEVQIAQAIAATDATKIGLSNFNSSHFSVDANGFVSLTGGGQAIDSFTTDVSGPVAPDAAGNVAFTGATNIFSSGSVANTMRLNLQGTNHALFVGRGTNTASSQIAVGTDGQLPIGATGADPAFATVATNANMNTVVGANSLTLNPYNCAKWIVDPTANIGTHQTIATAITAASSGDTIFIRPGTYTENLTLKAGVNLVSFLGDSNTPNVTIIGKATFTAAGTVSISNIRLQTNSDNFLAVTGSTASIVNLDCCYLNCSNNTGITFSSSSSSAKIQMDYCSGNLGTTGIGLFSHSSSGVMNINYCNIANTGASTTASTASAGELNLFFSYLTFAITTSSTNLFQDRQCHHNTSDINTLSLTMGGSGANIIRGSTITSGSASSISIGSSLLCDGINVSSSNTNAITGAGTIFYNAINFGNISSNINTTTQSLLNIGPSASVGSSNSGNTNTLTVTNSSNTASSSANIVSSVGGATAADPTFQSTVSGITTWTWGIDNSVTSPTVDPFVIAQGTALGTNNIMSVATSGEINYPLQSAFAAYVLANVTNATGDNTVVTVIAGTEIFDQNSDYNNATGVFTAPVTGRYRFSCGAQLGSVGAGHTAVNYQIVTSNRSADVFRVNGANCKDSSSLLTGNSNVFIDMDAADTMTFTVAVFNSTKTVSINGTAGANMNTFITGQLEC